MTKFLISFFDLTFTFFLYLTASVKTAEHDAVNTKLNALDMMIMEAGDCMILRKRYQNRKSDIKYKHRKQNEFNDLIYALQESQQELIRLKI